MAGQGYPPLRVVAGDREWVFDGSLLVTAGRGQGADVLLDEPPVSREHGELRPEANGQVSWRHTAGTWATNLTAISLVGAWWALRRRDPPRTWKRSRKGAAAR